jgi:hypothetical protein
VASVFDGANVTLVGEPSSSSCTIFVIGEFKKGKSSLVNALVGTSVCPNPVDLTTEITTVVSYGEHQASVLWDDGAERRRSMSWDDATTIISQPETLPGVAPRHVELAVPSPFLHHGCSMVDTPAVVPGRNTIGGASKASLAMASAVIVVSDASREYTATELDWIQSTAAAGASMVFALSKIDFYPAWRTVLSINQSYLDRLDLEAELLPTSARMVEVARSRHDGQLEADSGYPRLSDLLLAEVVAPAGRQARRLGSPADGAGSR